MIDTYLGFTNHSPSFVFHSATPHFFWMDCTENGFGAIHG